MSSGHCIGQYWTERRHDGEFSVYFDLRSMQCCLLSFSIRLWKWSDVKRKNFIQEKWLKHFNDVEPLWDTADGLPKSQPTQNIQTWSCHHLVVSNFFEKNWKKTINFASESVPVVNSTSTCQTTYHVLWMKWLKCIVKYFGHPRFKWADLSINWKKTYRKCAFETKFRQNVKF